MNKVGLFRQQFPEKSKWKRRLSGKPRQVGSFAVLAARLEMDVPGGALFDVSRFR
jgi:hypothetical protein